MDHDSSSLITDEFLGTVYKLGATQIFGPTSIGPKSRDPEALPFMVIPKHLEIHDLEHMLVNPMRKKGDVRVIDPDSFAEYFDNHADESTLLTASEQNLTIEAVIDHHGKNIPGWCDHILTMKLQRSKDWDKWVRHDGQVMSQTAFADFIEEMDYTIVEPSAASIIEIVTKIRLVCDKKFESKVNRTDGSVTFSYSDEIKQESGQLKMPTQMIVNMKPFKGAAAADVLVRIRYRLENASIRFVYQMVRPDAIVEEAFESVVANVEKLTGAKALRSG